MLVNSLKEFQGKSAATHSRRRVTISVDDTVVGRLGRAIALTYSWWSGRAKKVIRGQNILCITIKIGAAVIPLALRPVDKQVGTFSSERGCYARINTKENKFHGNVRKIGM